MSCNMLATSWNWLVFGDNLLSLTANCLAKIIGLMRDSGVAKLLQLHGVLFKLTSIEREMVLHSSPRSLGFLAAGS